MLYILADNQGITRVGIETLCLRVPGAGVKTVSNNLLNFLRKIAVYSLCLVKDRNKGTRHMLMLFDYLCQHFFH